MFDSTKSYQFSNIQVSDVITKYSSVVWNLGYIKDVKVLESVQRRWSKWESIKLSDVHCRRGRKLTISQK
ncbi:hypothetical protein E2C01_017361 [Portunus trituberculatus]|uniref:Uncharacterized protein n=1 Tax=Portunus trituberculatus TaxID=210409 RepID=A0A5B7DRF6_PORTR|nr:hypothetical protein [Portunus trituberculatus]